MFPHHRSLKNLYLCFVYYSIEIRVRWPSVNRNRHAPQGHSTPASKRYRRRNHFGLKGRNIREAESLLMVAQMRASSDEFNPLERRILRHHVLDFLFPGIPVEDITLEMLKAVEINIWRMYSWIVQCLHKKTNGVVSRYANWVRGKTKQLLVNKCWGIIAEHKQSLLQKALMHETPASFKKIDNWGKSLVEANKLLNSVRPDGITVTKATRIFARTTSTTTTSTTTITTADILSSSNNSSTNSSSIVDAIVNNAANIDVITMNALDSTNNSTNINTNLLLSNNDESLPQSSTSIINNNEPSSCIVRSVGDRVGGYGLWEDAENVHLTGLVDAFRVANPGKYRIDWVYISSQHQQKYEKRRTNEAIRRQYKRNQPAINSNNNNNNSNNNTDTHPIITYTDTISIDSNAAATSIETNQVQPEVTGQQHYNDTILENNVNNSGNSVENEDNHSGTNFQLSDSNNLSIMDVDINLSNTNTSANMNMNIELQVPSSNTFSFEENEILKKVINYYADKTVTGRIDWNEGANFYHSLCTKALHNNPQAQVYKRTQSQLMERKKSLKSHKKQKIFR